MLDSTTKKRIDDARDTLVGKIPDPKSQVEQITIALIYKFMDDMDSESVELGGEAKFFAGDYSKYSWRKVYNKSRGGQEILLDYSTALAEMSKNTALPSIFHTIFKQAYLPYNDPETLKSFLKIIDQFDYDHSEKLGDAFEYLLSVLGSQGDAGQFRTPRHIIDFMVEIVEPQNGDTILDPACGTAGFLISAYKHILKNNSSNGKSNGDQLSPDERKQLSENISGYDISPDMVRLSLVNMYLHRVTEPKIWEYDTLTSDARWNEVFDVVLANPPFMSPKGGIKPHSRFSVQSKRSEALFVDYIAEHLSLTGRGAVIVPEGVIFKSDAAFKKLRKMLVEENYLYGVISLPSGIFNPYSGVKTSILLFDKVVAKNTDKLLFAKIENDGFALGAQRRPIEGSQLSEMISAIKEFRATAYNEKEFSHPLCNIVDKNKIIENGDFNLSGERYVNNSNVISTKYPKVKIGDIFKTSSGGTPTKGCLEYYENGTIPWLRSGEVSQGYIYNAELSITKLALDNSSAKVFPVDTVLIAMYGATAGQVGILKFESSTNQAICGILPCEKVIPEYLFHIIRSQKEELIRISTGGAQPNISQSIIKNLTIPLPTIEEQKAIVAEIESYQQIIDAARTIVNNYRPQITIDPSWEMVELGKVCDVRDGTHDSPKYNIDGYPLVTSKNLKSGCIDFEETNLISKEDFDNINKRSKVDNGDIIMPMIGSIGNPIIVDSDKEFAIKNVALIKFNNSEISSKYVWLILKSEYFERYILENKRGVTQNFLSLKDIRTFSFASPSIETQQQIVSEIEREQKAVDSTKELIDIFEQKITNRIAQIWGE